MYCPKVEKLSLTTAGSISSIDERRTPVRGGAITNKSALTYILAFIEAIGLADVLSCSSLANQT